MNKLSIFADTLTSSNMKFCSLECLVMRYTEHPEEFMDDVVHTTGVEKDFVCFYCKKESE